MLIVCCDSILKLLYAGITTHIFINHECNQAMHALLTSCAGAVIDIVDPTYCTLMASLSDGIQAFDVMVCTNDENWVFVTLRKRI